MNIEQEFFFQSQLRLQLFFDSPNHCATILAMLSMVMTGLATWAWIASPRKWVFCLLALVIACGCLWGLSYTYSRGGWVAYTLGWLFYALTFIKGRRLSLLILGLFSLFILLLPHGLQRAGSITSVEEDRSISHRLLVWKGALAMAADHGVSGVGKSQFGTQFSAWYQPLTMNTRYQAALSNPLTIAAENGLIVFCIYLIIYFIPFTYCSYLAWKRQNVVILGLLSGSVVHFVSGLFTYSLPFWHVMGLFWIFYLICCGYALWAMWKDSHLRKLFVCMSGYIVGSSVLVSVAVFFYGLELLNNLTTRMEPRVILNHGIVLKGVEVHPQNQTVKGLIIYFHEKEENVLENGKIALRFMAERGYRVVSFDYRAGGRDGLEDAKAIIKEMTEKPDSPNVFLAGLGVGGRMSVLSVCDPALLKKISGVVSINANADWPFPDLAPLEQIANLSCPLLILHGSKNIKVPEAEAKELQIMGLKYGKQVDLKIIPDMGNFPGEKWGTVILEMDRFFQKQL